MRASASRRCTAATPAGRRSSPRPGSRASARSRRRPGSPSGALAAALAEAGPPAEDLVAAERSMCAAIGELLEAAQQAGAVRPDVGVEDVRLLFEQLHAVRAADPAREATLRRRYLELVLQALRAPAAAPLPGPAPAAAELRGRYDGR